MEMGKEQLCQLDLERPVEGPSGRSDRATGADCRPAEGEGENGSGEMPQVGFRDSFYQV